MQLVLADHSNSYFFGMFGETPQTNRIGLANQEATSQSMSHRGIAWLIGAQLFARAASAAFRRRSPGGRLGRLVRTRRHLALSQAETNATLYRRKGNTWQLLTYFPEDLVTRTFQGAEFLICLLGWAPQIQEAKSKRQWRPLAVFFKVTPSKRGYLGVIFLEGSPFWVGPKANQWKATFFGLS